MSKIQIQKRDMTQGSILGHIIRVALPMTWGIGVIISFSIIDTYFISLLGSQELAAIGFTMPITTLFFNVVFGLAIGTSSIVSRLAGAGKRDDIRITATISVTLAFILATILATIGCLTIDPVFKALGADGDVLHHIKEYMSIWYIGAIFLAVPVVANASIRGVGDAFWPAMVMTLVAFVNAILDPILIFGLLGAPELGMKGAAIASAISFVCASILALGILTFREKLFSPLCLRLKASWDFAFKPLIKIAIPVSLGSMIIPLVASVYTAFLASMPEVGNAAVAAYGVITRFEAFLMIPLMGVASGMAPLIGQNWGAEKFDRLREAMAIAIKFSVVYGILGAFIFWLIAPMVTGFFTQDPMITDFTLLYLMIVPISFVGLNIFSVISSALNAIGRPEVSFVLTLVKAFLVAIPLAWVMMYAYGYDGFVWSIFITNVLGGGCSLFFLRQICKRHIIAADKG